MKIIIILLAACVGFALSLPNVVYYGPLLKCGSMIGDACEIQEAATSILSSMGRIGDSRLAPLLEFHVVTILGDDYAATSLVLEKMTGIDLAPWRAYKKYDDDRDVYILITADRIYLQQNRDEYYEVDWNIFASMVSSIVVSVSKCGIHRSDLSYWWTVMENNDLNEKMAPVLWLLKRCDYHNEGAEYTEMINTSIVGEEKYGEKLKELNLGVYCLFFKDGDLADLTFLQQMENYLNDQLTTNRKWSGDQWNQVVDASYREVLNSPHQAFADYQHLPG